VKSGGGGAHDEGEPLAAVQNMGRGGAEESVGVVPGLAFDLWGGGGVKRPAKDGF
jgi:hypothetical protein